MSVREYERNVRKSEGKLLAEGMTPKQIDAHRDELIAPNGKLYSGWGGKAAYYAKQANEDAAKSMSKMEMGMQLEAARKMARLNYELTQQGIEANIDRYPRISEIGRAQTKTQVVELNDLLKSEYEASLDEYYPEWRTDILGALGDAQADTVSITQRFKENILPKAMDAADRMSAQAISNAESMLRGDLPDDVAAQVRRHAAEISNQIGVRGQAAQYLTARDIGKTSLDLMQLGLEYAPQALALGSSAYLGLNETLQAPVKTGMDATNLLKAYLPNQVDPASVFSGNLAALVGAGTIPAGTIMSTTANVMHSGASLASDAFQSALEYNSQQYWNRQNLAMQEKALKEQKRANTLGFVGSLFGSGAKVWGAKD